MDPDIRVISGLQCTTSCSTTTIGVARGGMITKLYQFHNVPPFRQFYKKVVLRSSKHGHVIGNENRKDCPPQSLLANSVPGCGALSELKILRDGMESDLAKHVKELPKGFPSKKAIGVIAPAKTYESNFIPHDFVQFRKFNAILPPTVLSQQCCDVCFTSLTVVAQ